MAPQASVYGSRIRRSFQLFLIILLAVLGAAAQSTQPTPEPSPTPALSTEPADESNEAPVRVKTDLVTLTLTVQDNYGRYVTGLSKEAFSVTDNNVPQDITFFSDAAAPISVGILFDVSGSMSGDKINKARKALSRLLLTSRPSDE